ncbi:hypothetical protein DPMN_069126 [Dreissena polymorpha]|uniref:Uncharacterized protein n=1 Tax=Dreissena polymorpha TaxID=45954 RepID=A0A9D3YYW0_DREPO|nr:hypothetical protein DPMN_069126 [Dreissena polymorpha]
MSDCLEPQRLSDGGGRLPESHWAGQGCQRCAVLWALWRAPAHVEGTRQADVLMFLGRGQPPRGLGRRLLYLLRKHQA